MDALHDGIGSTDFSSVSLPSVTVTILGTPDYDTNNNGLIEIRTLAQLNAIRWDVNGDGDVSSGNAANYLRAFPRRDTNAATRMGCPSGTCTGYELMNDLDFDENGNGSRDDTYNTGAGWNPIGTTTSFFTATFNGNGYTIANLFINRPENNIGLFGISSTAVIENLGLVNVNVTGVVNVGSLVGLSGSGTIRACYATGTVTGFQGVGGLVGSLSSTLTASYARVRVVSTNSADTNPGVGGLVGGTNSVTITASYALGPVTGTPTNTMLGGLVGSINPGDTVTNSYWDTETTGQSSSAGSPDTAGKTTAELQTPTDYTGIYANWNVNVDGVTGNDNPWAFGEDYQYPVLRYGRTPAQIQFQFNLQTLATANVNRDDTLDAQDALLMYQTYLPALRGTGVVDTAIAARATAWQRNGRAVGGDLNSDGDINEQDALIMYYTYQFRELLQNSAVLRQRLFNGLRGSGRRQMPPTDTTYREFLRRALRLR